MRDQRTQAPADIEVFDCYDEPYQRWLVEHPKGYVVNTRRRHDPDYVVLHRATCHSIKQAARSTADDPFTGQNYIKICAVELDARCAGLRSRGLLAFSKRCGLCGG